LENHSPIGNHDLSLPMSWYRPFFRHMLEIPEPFSNHGIILCC
jgi:hypothetical protein